MRRYSRDRRSRLLIEQLKLARHLRHDRRGMTIRSADRRDIDWRQSSRGGDEIMIGQHTIRRIEPDPARPRQKNFRPGMKRTFGALRLRIAFPQITTR